MTEFKYKIGDVVSYKGWNGFRYGVVTNSVKDGYIPDRDIVWAYWADSEEEALKAFAGGDIVGTTYVDTKYGTSVSLVREREFKPGDKVFCTCCNNLYTITEVEDNGSLQKRYLSKAGAFKGKETLEAYYPPVHDKLLNPPQETYKRVGDTMEIKVDAPVTNPSTKWLEERLHNQKVLVEELQQKVEAQKKHIKEAELGVSRQKKANKQLQEEYQRGIDRRDAQIAYLNNLIGTTCRDGISQSEIQRIHDELADKELAIEMLQQSRNKYLEAVAATTKQYEAHKQAFADAAKLLTEKEQENQLLQAAVDHQSSLLQNQQHQEPKHPTLKYSLPILYFVSGLALIQILPILF